MKIKTVVRVPRRVEELFAVRFAQQLALSAAETWSEYVAILDRVLTEELDARLGHEEAV